MTQSTDSRTEVGSYFVSNYPPYSLWREEYRDQVEAILRQPPAERTPLGLYVHIPFCRKRCKFCYFRVYTDKKKTERDQYLAALGRELELYSQLPVVGDRPLTVLYVGGGTPSALTEEQLDAFADVLGRHWALERLEEFTFECEPGTLTEAKVRRIRDLGVTRLSLGVENFNDAVLKENGRAHLSPEVYASYEWIQAAGFQQVNVDLIAGMVGETDDNWRDGIRRTLELSPDSVTVYQMELPYNTVISRDVLDGGESPIASWDKKREWVREAFAEFRAAGYETSSAYTVVKPSAHGGFRYRDALWNGGDLMGAGVASFSYMQGVHYQNVDDFWPYVSRCESGELPVHRGYAPTAHQRLVRELILQLKLGRISAAPFREKFGVDIFDEFSEAFARLQDEGWLRRVDDGVHLTEAGLLRVDGLLPQFYEDEHRHARYT